MKVSLQVSESLSASIRLMSLCCWASIRCSCYSLRPCRASHAPCGIFVSGSRGGTPLVGVRVRIATRVDIARPRQITRAIRSNARCAARHRHHHVQFVAALLDVCGRSRLQTEREQRAVASLLRLNVGKSSAPHCLSARHIGGGNFHIEAIAAPVRFIIIQ